MKMNRLTATPGVPPWRNDSAIKAVFAIAVFLDFPASASSVAPFSTFWAANVAVQGVGHDASGDIFVLGAADTSPIAGHVSEIVMAKLDPSATKVGYFVYLGGSGTNAPRALAVDAQGNAYIAGYTSSNDFPVTSGFSGPVPPGLAVPFIVKLNPNGGIVYATLFAGAVTAFPQALAVDSEGDATISGYANPGYPATQGTISADDFDRTTNTAPFATKLDASGTKVLFSALGIGGGQIAIAPQGDIFVAGNTSSTSYPTTPGAFQTTFTPSSTCSTGPGIGLCFPANEQYVTRLSSDGTKLIYSSFIAGSSGATNSGLAVDSDGNAYVTGTTPSKDYPFTGTSGTDRPGLFLTKLDPTGSRLLWSVQQGGNVLTLDTQGNPTVGGSFVPITGRPGSPPATSIPPPPPTGNTPAACLPNGATVQSIGYVQSFNAKDGTTAATQLLSATQATASAITTEPDGRIILGGYTYFPDIPLSPGVVFSDAVAQRTVPGSFLAALDLLQAPSNSPLGCIVDSATLFPVGPVAPGQLITLFGYQIGPQAGASGFSAAQASLPTSLGNVQVTFDGTPAPLLYVSSDQVNVQVPFTVAQQNSTVMAIHIGSTILTTRMLAVTSSNPSIFLDTSVSPANCDSRLANSVAFAAVALNSDGSLNSCTNPAKVESTVTVFLNGVAAMLGGAFPASGSITGPNPNPFGSQVDVRGGVLSLAAGPLYPASGSIAGVDQLAIQLPAISGSGLQEVNLELAIDGLLVAPFEAYSGVLHQQPVIIWVKQ